MSAQRRPATKRDRGPNREGSPPVPTAATNGSPAPATAAPAPRASSRPPMPAAASRPPKPAAAARPAKPPATSRPPRPEPDRPPQGRVVGGLARRTEGLRTNYRDTVAELKKVNWPDRETTRNLTIVVIAVSIALGILLGGVDFLLRAIFSAIP